MLGLVGCCLWDELQSERVRDCKDIFNFNLPMPWVKNNSETPKFAVVLQFIMVPICASNVI